MHIPWRITMFGGLAAERGDVVNTHFRTRKTAALLAHLAYHVGRSHSREVLTELLWPDSEPDSGRRNLRSALSSLRHQLEPSGVPAGSVIQADRQTVQLNPAAVTTDVGEFEVALRDAAAAGGESERARHLQQATDLYRGEFLAGLYEDWILTEQRRLADLYFQSVRRLADYYEKNQEWENALNCARRAVAIDPLREDAQRDLMRLLASAGQPFAAMNQFRELERILKDELSVAPTGETLELVRTIEVIAADGLASETIRSPSVLTILVASTAPAMAGKEKVKTSGTSGREIETLQILRKISDEFLHAEEVGRGDGPLVLSFSKPSESVRFALLAQSRWRKSATAKRQGVALNIGIHLSELEERGAGESPASGMLDVPVALASNVTALARGGQILMTRGVFDNARQIFNGRAVPGIGELRWVSHGPYVVRGFEDPVAICEVGEVGPAPLRPPPDSEAGRSAAVPGTELVLGWRPALGQVIPQTEWDLETKLGEGGFGEVWRARHRKTDESRVFKFCFRADKLRYLKREMTLFRLLQETLGDRDDIARLHSVQFEEAPFYLEFEDTPGGNLIEWIARQGGFDRITLETRLEIVAQIANALSAAHSVGVLHKDVKPSNVLVDERGGGTFQVRLTDFGIGQLLDREILSDAGITATGFTETLTTERGSGSPSGTRLYMAPELLADQPCSVQSDVYSLGVLLYQLVTGDLGRPLTTDWERRVRDPLLRKDLRIYLAGDPRERPADADFLAERLRSLPRRRRRRRTTQAARVAAAVFALLSVVAAAVSWIQLSRHRKAEQDGARESAFQRRIESAKERAERSEYGTRIAQAARLIDDRQFEKAKEVLVACPPRYRHWEWGRLLHLCHLDVMTLHPENDVESLAFSPDGRFLATTNELWDLQSGQRVMSLPADKGLWCSVAFSPDGRRLLTGTQDRTATVWNARTGQEILSLEGHSDWVRDAVFSPDGRHIATASWDSTARLWDAENGREIRAFTGHRGAIDCVAFSPDGQWLATGSYDATARLWDVETGRELREYSGHIDPVVSVDFSPNGQRLATGSRDRTTGIWDVETGQRLAVLEGHALDVFGVSFSPTADMVATASDDRTARLWDSDTGRLLATLEGHTDKVHSIAFSPDGRLVATGTSTKPEVRIWDVASCRGLKRLEAHSRPVQSVAFSPDGNRLVTAGADGLAYVWDLATGKRTLSVNPSGGPLWAAAFAPEGNSLVLAPTGRLQRRDVETGRIHPIYRDQTTGVVCLALSSDGRYLASATGGEGIHIRDMEAGGESLSIHAPPAPICAIAFSPDGSRLARASAGDQAARVYDVRTGEPIVTFERHEAPLTSLAFSSDGRRLATGSLDGTARLWNAETGTEVLRFSGHALPVRDLALSHDGLQLATASEDGTAVVWDARTGERGVTLKGHAFGLQSIAFDPCGRRLATASSDGTARIWNAQTGREILRVETKRSGVRNVAFSPDGLLLATGGRNGAVGIWNAETGRSVRKIEAHSRCVGDLAFGPGGVSLVSAGMDKRVRIWDVETGAELEALEGSFLHSTFAAINSGGELVAMAGIGKQPILGLWEGQTGRWLRKLNPPDPRISSVSFSPGGKLLATTDLDWTVALLDVETGRTLRSWEGTGQRVAFSPDGRRLAAGHADGTLTLLDTLSAEPTWRVSAHAGGILSICFSPDGARILTGAHQDPIARLWDVETGKQMLSLTGHTGEIRTVAWSLQGTRLATGSADGAATVWRALPREETAYPGDSAMPLDERIELYKRGQWKDRLAGAKHPPIQSARRQLNATSYTHGIPIRVKLDIARADEPSTLTVVESIPERWVVRDVSHDGNLSGDLICWRLAPSTSSGLTLEYTATPHATAGFHPAGFAGAFMRSGDGLPMAIEDTWLPATGALVLQDGVYPSVEYDGCQDATIADHHPDFNAGGCDHLIDVYTAGAPSRILVRFDLSSVPPSFSLKRAELRLFADGEEWSRHAMYAARLLKPWNEGEGLQADGAPALKGDVTFNSAQHGVLAWELPGAMGLTDVAEWESAAMTGGDWPRWVVFDVTESVRDFLTTPSLNYGWKISQGGFRGAEPPDISYCHGTYTYKSSEAPEAHRRPMLVLIRADNRVRKLLGKDVGPKRARRVGLP